MNDAGRMNSAEHVSGTGHANGTGGADQSFWRGMLGLILPRGCAGCDKPDDVLCDDCHALFRRHLAMPLYGTMQSGAAQGESRQETMIRREVSGDWQADASQRSDAWQPAMPQSGIPQCLIHAAGLYQGNVRRAILSWKDHGDAECDKSFAHVCRELVAGSGLVETLKTADPSAGLSASGSLASGSLATATYGYTSAYTNIGHPRPIFVQIHARTRATAPVAAREGHGRRASRRRSGSLCRERAENRPRTGQSRGNP